jgi:hypothetical protein
MKRSILYDNGCRAIGFITLGLGVGYFLARLAGSVTSDYVVIALALILLVVGIVLHTRYEHHRYYEKKAVKEQARIESIARQN